MKPRTPFHSSFIVWRWGDDEIEDPKILRRQLKEIHLQGFSGVIAALWETRYEVIDAKVVVAVAQVSQWAKARGLIFWFQADPRQASRTLIFRTGERTQNLIVTRNPEDGLNPDNLNLARIENNKFNLRYHFPQSIHTHIIQEISLNFEPSGLERVFLFQMAEGSVIAASVIDITRASRFFANMDEGYVEVFGEVGVSGKEDWRVLAFPRFDTNLTDFAGHESQRYLLHMVDGLFDAGAYIDGFIWDNSGFCGDIGRFPVSEAIYKSFWAQYGYHLQPHLLALVLDHNDASHVLLRQHYYSLLMNLIDTAQNNLKTYFHSFFETIDCALPHARYPDGPHFRDLASGSIDPWQGLETQETGMTTLNCSRNAMFQFDDVLTRIVLTRSLGVYSRSRKALMKIFDREMTLETLTCAVDLMLMHSVRWLVDAYGEPGRFEPPCAHPAAFPAHPLWSDLLEVNRNMEVVGSLTGFSAPITNVALLYPVETILSADPQSAEFIIEGFYRFAAQLIRSGIQLDILSTRLFRQARLTDESIRVTHRHYQSVIYPYPEIIHPDVLELTSLMKRKGFQILLGGPEPDMTSTGRNVPHHFTPDFDSETVEADQIHSLGIRPLFDLPDHCVGTKMYAGMKSFYLLRADSPSGMFSGTLSDGELKFEVPETQGLVIYQADDKAVMKQIYPPETS